MVQSKYNNFIESKKNIENKYLIRYLLSTITETKLQTEAIFYRSSVYITQLI